MVVLVYCVDHIPNIYVRAFSNIHFVRIDRPGASFLSFFVVCVCVCVVSKSASYASVEHAIYVH